MVYVCLLFSFMFYFISVKITKCSQMRTALSQNVMFHLSAAQNTLCGLGLCNSSLKTGKDCSSLITDGLDLLCTVEYYLADNTLQPIP